MDKNEIMTKINATKLTRIQKIFVRYELNSTPMVKETLGNQYFEFPPINVIDDVRLYETRVKLKVKQTSKVTLNMMIYQTKVTVIK